MKKREKVYKIIMLIVVVATITFILTALFMYNLFGGAKYASLRNNLSKSLDDQNTNLNISTESKIGQVLTGFRTLIDSAYLGDVDENKLVEGAIKGYISGLGDEYTEYFTKDEMESFSTQALGNYVGIGVYIAATKDTNQIVVLAPVKDGPADKAGIVSGDVITKINNQEYTGDQLTVASNAMKGAEGTKVSIEVLRNNETLTFDITEEKIKLVHIESEVLENNIGYIKLSTFDEDSAKEFKSAIDDLTSKNVKSIIVDLRNNGGGIVTEALDMVNYILPKDATTLITVNKKGDREVSKVTDDHTVDLPFVILTNEYTASASEIFSAALKDNNRATLVGKNTYGKGVIQTLLTLKDGSGIKITTNEYYRANEEKLNHIGIKPDVEVDLDESQKSKKVVEHKDDNQLQKAIETIKTQM